MPDRGEPLVDRGPGLFELGGGGDRQSLEVVALGFVGPDCTGVIFDLTMSRMAIEARRARGQRLRSSAQNRLGTRAKPALAIA